MTRDIVYLDNAATTFPKPPGVGRAVKECIDGWCGNPGRGAHPIAERSAETVYNARATLAEFFDAKAENTVFTPNATVALNYAIKGLAPRGHVLISDLEHNAVVRPVISRGQPYSIFPTAANAEEILDDIASHIRRDTRAVVCTAASNLCPAAPPIEAIGRLCMEKNLFFIVDASQAAGKQTLDMKKMNIDALCAPGHKGLYGPQGTGFVIFSERAAEAVCHAGTLIEGGNGVNSREAEMPDFLPERLEAGTLNVPAIYGLCEGIGYVKSRGIKNISSAECRLCGYARDSLERMRGVTVYAEKYRRGSLFIFNIDGRDSEDTARALSERGICVRAGLHCAPLAHATLGTPEHGAVRVSLGAFNKPSDVDALIRAVREIK